MDHLDTENDYRLTLKDIQDISSELLSSVSPDFYPDGDAVAAARKALDI